jgi:choline dehydrogenase
VSTRRDADVVVVGGGTSGAALAGLLAEADQVDVLLIEAGPDYGPRLDGAWPADLLDARRLPVSHGWGYAGLAHRSHPKSTPFDRARVVGGCSAHNGCVALAGIRSDYERWGERVAPAWGWDAVQPAFRRARERLRVSIPDIETVQPFQRAFIEAARSGGLSFSPDLDDPDEAEGVGVSPVNIVGGVRWSSAFAYLDPVRSSDRLRVRADALVSKVVVGHGRALGVEIITAGGTESIPAGAVVVAAGAYGSPPILLRSGIGDPADLAGAGVVPVHELPGVGRGLADHPLCYLEYAPSDALARRMAAAAAVGWVPEEQALAKAMLPDSPEPVAVHLFPWSPGGADGGPIYQMTVALTIPRSSGQVRLRDADPLSPPLIDHGYLSDPDGRDRRDLAAGVRIGRRVMRRMIDNGDMEAELTVLPDDDKALMTYVDEHVSTYFHPVCSCRMGSDDMAVVDAAGRVRGIDGLRVCDASIFPTLPRANTNLPAAMVAEHMAEMMLRY